jgi:hypothetical protein
MIDDFEDDVRRHTELLESVDCKVKEFCSQICDIISAHYPDRSVDIDEDFVADETEKYHSTRMYIRTDYGCVCIVPNFRKKSAAGIIINMGKARGMFLEGFTEEQIDAEGDIFSNPIPYSKNSVEVLAYYLTHKVINASAREF